MFQFRRFPAYAYFIQRTLTGSSPAGLPHSDIHGSMRMCRSPWLFAACHVLLRLLMPRHPPCALLRLTFVVAGCASFAFSLRLSPSLKSSFASPLLLCLANPLRWALLGFFRAPAIGLLLRIAVSRIMQAPLQKFFYCSLLPFNLT